mmetsp:Transcript_904/g.3541  ORF Transcript_904/g.3541 Transcript_904/m.3541 type:complete len:297 (-) Transcript_904:3363-4253(-)
MLSCVGRSGRALGSTTPADCVCEGFRLTSTRAICALTLSTLQRTSAPGGKASSGLDTKASARFLSTQRASKCAPRLTKQPFDVVALTYPGRRSPADTSVASVRRASDASAPATSLPAAAPLPPSEWRSERSTGDDLSSPVPEFEMPLFLLLPAAAPTRVTAAVTTSPTSNAASGSGTKVSPISVMCTRPVALAPSCTSRPAPGSTRPTRPRTTSPSLRSSSAERADAPAAFDDRLSVRSTRRLPSVAASTRQSTCMPSVRPSPTSFTFAAAAGSARSKASTAASRPRSVGERDTIA